MQNFSGSWKIFPLYSSSIAIISILVLGGILVSPSEPGNILLIGLSLPRLIFALGLSASFFFFAFLTIRALRDQGWAERSLEWWFGGGRVSAGLTWLAGISFGLGWIGCFLPAYRLGALAGYWMRIHPAMVFILLASIATLGTILIKRGKFPLQNLRIYGTLRLGGLLLFGCLAIVGVMLVSGFGVRTYDDFWYGAGVPILMSQLIVAVLGGNIFWQVEKKWRSDRMDLLVFLLIHAVTAMLWIREPLQESFFFTAPYPPNREFYPFSDSAIFDTASQFALIGQGILNGSFFERPLYLSLLVYLHSLLGENYETLMAAQAGIFAILPALIYLIGRSLNMRAIGFSSAIVATLRGINSISASNMIDLASPKMMLTDYPTAIGIALIVLLTCEWLKKSAQKQHYALWIGGAIGFTIMLRTNALVFLLLIPLYALPGIAPQWKKWATGSLLLILAMFAITLPWELRNQSRGGIMYGSFFTKFQSVIEQRYIPPSESGSSLPQEHGWVYLSFKNTEAALSLSQTIETARINKPCDQVVCFAPNHFLHNMLTSILALPTSPLLDDLRHTVKDNNTYWLPKWDGSFAPSSMFFFSLNIALFVLGISVAWTRGRLHSTAPLTVFIFYNASNALARTSGGRYLVPMDWIVSIYFMLGVFQVIAWISTAVGINHDVLSESLERNQPNSSVPSRDLLRTAAILLVLFGLGSLIPLAENLHARRYQDSDPTKALLEYERSIADAGLDMREVDRFLKYTNAQILVGRTLYPRHYPMDRGEIYYFPYVAMGFPRLAFILIGPNGEQGVVLPGDVPRYFPHGAGVLVLGCREEKYVDALAVILLDENSAVYTRAPSSDLQCPLRQPVCNNNRVCR
jgi:hypothetical protein